MLDPEKLVHELSVRGKDWADKDAAYYLLDETKKDVLSMCVAKVNDQGLSQVAKEQQARLMPEWQEQQEALARARKAMNEAKVNYSVWQAYIELIRSREATNRAEAGIR